MAGQVLARRRTDSGMTVRAGGGCDVLLATEHLAEVRHVGRDPIPCLAREPRDLHVEHDPRRDPSLQAQEFLEPFTSLVLVACCPDDVDDVVPALLCDEKGLKEGQSVLGLLSFTRVHGDMITHL